jgi:hypothetical protein
MQASNKRPPAKKRFATKATLHFRGGGGFSVSIAGETFAALILSNAYFTSLRRAGCEKLLISSPQYGLSPSESVEADHQVTGFASLHPSYEPDQIFERLRDSYIGGRIRRTK